MADAVTTTNTNEAQKAVSSMGDKPLNLQHLSMNQLRYLGAQMAASGMFPDVKDGPKALVKILAGQEIGMPPFQAMTNIHIIQGKATMAANMMAAKVKGSGKYDYRLKLSTTEATVTIYQLNSRHLMDTAPTREELGSFTYTMKDAERAGLVKPGSGWVKYPQNMLFARAISTAVRMYAPDVFNGNAVYSPEELGAPVDEDGNYVEGELHTAETPVTTQSNVDNEESRPTEPQHPDTTTEEVAEIMSTHDAKAEVITEDQPLTRKQMIAKVQELFADAGIDDTKGKEAYCTKAIDKARPTTDADYNKLIVALLKDTEGEEN